MVVKRPAAATRSCGAHEISFDAEDGMGGICSGAVNVYVPHDQGTGDVPVDDGQNYDATEIN